MVVRKIVYIDEDLCNGCGQCIPNCAEQALQLVDEKVKLVEDAYCDGLGACLGLCPQGAISIIEREASPFNESALPIQHGEPIAKSTSSTQPFQHPDTLIPPPSNIPSALTHWPIQLNLVPVKASFFDNRDLLVLADCVPVAYPQLHSSLLNGRSVVIGCPKFDDAPSYAEKLSEIVQKNKVKSITVAHMEVPCCSGLHWIVDRAVQDSGKQLPLKRHVITVRGEMK
jgi:NAD-dependent dihydropyrimidine dehydrogenase PreA subunit